MSIANIPTLAYDIRYITNIPHALLCRGSWAVLTEQTGRFLILLCQISVIMPISDKPVCGILASVPGMGIVGENTHFCGSETDSTERKNVHGEKKSGGTSFSSTPNTHETYRACSHFAIAHLRRFLTFWKQAIFFEKFKFEMTIGYVCVLLIF